MKINELAVGMEVSPVTEFVAVPISFALFTLVMFGCGP